MLMMKENTGVSSSKIKFRDMRCEHAEFPKEDSIDGSGTCRTFMAIYCNYLKKYVIKNAPLRCYLEQEDQKQFFRGLFLS